jgi:hypothetical protein
MLRHGRNSRAIVETVLGTILEAMPILLDLNVRAVLRLFVHRRIFWTDCRPDTRILSLVSRENNGGAAFVPVSLNAAP